MVGRNQSVLDTQCLAAHIKRVVACESLGFGCEAVGELSAVVGKQLDDLFGAHPWIGAEAFK